MTYKIINFDSLKVGDERELKHKIIADDIQRFAELTGDRNPLHLDVDFAQQVGFRKPVVYGMLSASFISTMIGMFLPGPGALWLSQTLQFNHHVHEGDEIRVVAKVKQKSDATRIIILETKIFNQRNEEVIAGEAKVRLLDLAGKDVNMEKKTKVVLVTGASRGIGAAIARRLAKDGHKVVVNYAHSSDEANKVVDFIKSEGGEAIAIKANIANQQEVVNMCQQASQQFGPIDAFVQNASGAIHIQPFAQTQWQSVQTHFDVQVQGAFHCLQTILPGMIEQGGGSVVVIGSIASDSTPPTQQAAYVVAKAALSALARSLAAEYGPKNIRVNVVSPGLTQTDLTAEMPQKAIELTRMTTPLRRLGQPEDIANIVAFLIGAESRHITGETIRACGGAVMV